MLVPGTLNTVFSTYWLEMERCRNARAYWALLHVSVCLPDICAALQAPNGETTGPRYIDWCEKYLPDPLLSGAERYRMRCKVLHQGRATTDLAASRYIGFSFGQPSPSGHVDHKRVDAGALNLDVGLVAEETRQAVARWIHVLESNPVCAEAMDVAVNLGSLVQVRQLPFPVPNPSQPGVPTFESTLKTS